MDKENKIIFQFISEPSDINYGGKVHGGVVMKWIDQVANACSSKWAQGYCVTIYVGGIRFYKPINIGEIIKIEAYVIYTGKTSIHIAVDVYSRHLISSEFVKKTHCVIVFVAVDFEGNPREVEKFHPKNEEEEKLEQYALRLKELREVIDVEMEPFVKA